ncbi:MAG: hypothetical protein LC632_03125 [Xanthomonadaceae bacterium]|nr:hypothetical protein [Xanthomonadaceae bacterium]
MSHRLIPLFLLPLVLAAGCERQSDDGVVEPLPEAEVVSAEAANLFMENLRTMCGNSYRGELLEFNEGDADMVGQALVMHVRDCDDDEIRIPFHVGENRSRTWIFTLTEEGLRLKHDHRQPDGSDDEVTMYGGDTVEVGTGTRQAFHADRYTGEMLPVSANNVWTVEVIPGEVFSYYLRRRNEPLEFRADGAQGVGGRSQCWCSRLPARFLPTRLRRSARRAPPSPWRLPRA